MAPRYMKPGEDFSFDGDFGFTGSTSGNAFAKPHPQTSPDEYGDGSYLARASQTPLYAKGGPANAKVPKIPGAGRKAVPAAKAAGAAIKALELGSAIGQKVGAARAGGALNRAAPPPMGAPPMAAPAGMPPMGMRKGGKAQRYARGGDAGYDADEERQVRAAAPATRSADTSKNYPQPKAFRKGGDVDQDKALVRKGIRQHENQEHGGKHSKLKLAQGGATEGQDSHWYSPYTHGDLPDQSTRAKHDAAMQRWTDAETGGPSGDTEEESIGRRLAILPPEIEGTGRHMVDGTYRTVPDKNGKGRQNWGKYAKGGDIGQDTVKPGRRGDTGQRRSGGEYLPYAGGQASKDNARPMRPSFNLDTHETDDQMNSGPGYRKGGKFIKKGIKHPGRIKAMAAREGVSTLQAAEKASHSSDPSLRAAGNLGKRFIKGDLHRGKK